MVRPFFWAAGTPFTCAPVAPGDAEAAFDRLIEAALDGGFDLLELSGFQSLL